MSNYVEAFEIATEAIERERRTRVNRASTHLAGAALEALEKAGFVLMRPVTAEEEAANNW